MEAGEVKELLIILKTDVQAQSKCSKILSKALDRQGQGAHHPFRSGAITESDVLLASASNATTSGAATVIIGFNVRPESRADEIASRKTWIYGFIRSFTRSRKRFATR
jgi:translation initiation factor IF-2